MGRRHKRTPVRNWLRDRYYGAHTGIWARIRAGVERNGGIEATKMDIMTLMVATCLVGIIAIAFWMALTDTLTWP